MEQERLIQIRRDYRGLAEDLRGKIQGEVRFDDGARGLYATDGSNYRQIPIGVVVPRTVEDVLATVESARRFGAPILGRGCGTSLAGQCCNTAVILDFSKYLNKLVSLDPDARTAVVQPGLILDQLRHAAEQHHLTFAPDPATHAWCTLGGMLGNNSCGIHALMGGKSVDNTIELDILTYDGTRMTVGETSDAEFERVVREGGRKAEIYAGMRALIDRYAKLVRARFPRIPRRVSGYNLDQLLPESGFHVARALVGTESTCALILQAKLRLVHSPPKRALLVLGYPDVYTAGDHVMEVLEAKPVGLEGVDHDLIHFMRLKGTHMSDLQLLPEGGGWLLVELGGETEEEAADAAHGLMGVLRSRKDAPTMKLLTDPKQQHRIWEIRESGLSATAHVPGQRSAWPGWEDSAVPPDKLGGYLRDLRALFQKYGYNCALYGHFGQGCVHTRIDFDLFTAHGIAQFKSFLEEAADMVTRYGGSLSGEHGDGQARGPLLPRMFGDELVEAFKRFKALWDPDWKMNPGKVVEPYGLTENLRLGTAFRPEVQPTHFHYPEDHDSFARATLRCVGVGKCRRLDTGTMCPSFMVTREEEHTTRGRARLLFEMIKGEEVKGGFKSDHVKEALDLCLACKGCKGDCPVGVDMATYKAEFLSHYYAGRLRPMAAYSMGLIRLWSQIAGHMPSVANFFTQARGVSDVAKLLGGIAEQRRMPPYANQTFKQWFRARRPRFQRGRPVVLFADTFNDFFDPDNAIAAVDVMEAAGFDVQVPMENLCCGRPLYDFGFLDRAERTLKRVLHAMRPVLDAGTPVVVLEPSCAAVFRDEMTNLFPHDEDAKRLKRQVKVLSELLEEDAKDFHIPPLRRKAVVQKHCHHQAVIGMEAYERVLSRMEMDAYFPDSGCCGMAGSFGFERGRRYEVSMACGERVILPCVRKAPEDTLILANGFSCREQIKQGTNRQPLHLSKVVQLALRGPGGVAGE